MKNLIFWTCGICMSLTLTLNAQEPGLDEILAKYYAANGTEKTVEWNSVKFTGKTNAQGMEFPITLFWKKPGKFRSEVTIQSTRMISGFDGERGWFINPYAGSSEPQDMTEDMVKSVADQSDFEGELFRWKEKGHTLEYLGKEDLDGSPVYKIKVTRKNGNVTTSYIDAESFVIVKTSSLVKIQDNEVESESFSSNYKEVNGVLLPFSIENRYKGQTVSNTLVDRYEIGLEIPDSLFVKPVKK